MPFYGTAPSTVLFTNISSSNFTSWLWTFGDGSTSTAENPTCMYSIDGTYVVTLTATNADGESVTFSDLVVIGLLDTGWVQPDPAYAGCPGTDPQVMLRVSNDGGKTWISESWRSAGKTGEFYRRVRWNRLGAGRRRVFEISVTDPIPWRILGAYIHGPGIEG